MNTACVLSSRPSPSVLSRVLESAQSMLSRCPHEYLVAHLRLKTGTKTCLGRREMPIDLTRRFISCGNEISNLIQFDLCLKENRVFFLFLEDKQTNKQKRERKKKRLRKAML